MYNGTKEQPESKVLKLSDAFSVPEEEPELELYARMLNINKGHNSEIMEACRTLKDYAEYIDRIRRYAETTPINEAVERAITECIAEGILADFLSRNRAEAVKMSIYEYDEEKHMRQEREEWEAIGRAEGKAIGRAEGKMAGETRMSRLVECLLNAGRLDELKRATQDEKLREKLYLELEIKE